MNQKEFTLPPPSPTTTTRKINEASTVSFFLSLCLVFNARNHNLMAITRAERLAASNQRLTTFIILKTQVESLFTFTMCNKFLFTFHIANLPIPWKPQKLIKKPIAFGPHNKSLWKKKKKKAHQLSTALLQVESFIRHFKVLHGIGSLKMALLYKAANATTTQKLIPIFCVVIRVISMQWHY